MAHLEYFSESRIAITRELKNHPDLIEQIEESGQEDWHDILGVIAAHFNVILDGAYSDFDIAVLEDKLWNKLVAKRKLILTPPVGRPLQ